ncbi:MAG: tetratricopeptide repeat protein [Elusimicrobia bacterium]|nr:tetratricopeptide repeat protein [Elusimicrobiota bacterium]
MYYLTFLTALSLLFLGLVFFYRPNWVLYFNRVLREKFLNDSLVLLNRRKKGVFFLLLSSIFFYWGYLLSQYRPSRLSQKIISTDRLLYQSMRHLDDQQYEKSKSLCERVLSRDPNNADALYHLGAAHLLLNNQAQGESFWNKAVELDPRSSEASRLRGLITRTKGQVVSSLK